MSHVDAAPVLFRSVRRNLCDDLIIDYEGFHRPQRILMPNLGPNGMFINTPEYFPEGAVLKIQFRLPDCEVVVRTRAEVRHCLPGVGVGVEFVDMSLEDRLAILQAIGENLEELEPEPGE
jgi:hypothetical protein